MSVRVRSVAFRAVLVLPPSERRKEKSRKQEHDPSTRVEEMHTNCASVLVIWPGSRTAARACENGLRQIDEKTSQLYTAGCRVHAPIKRTQVDEF